MVLMAIDSGDSLHGGKMLFMERKAVEQDMGSWILVLTEAHLAILSPMGMGTLPKVSLQCNWQRRICLAVFGNSHFFKESTRLSELTRESQELKVPTEFWEVLHVIARELEHPVAAHSRIPRTLGVAEWL